MIILIEPAGTARRSECQRRGGILMISSSDNKQQLVSRYGEHNGEDGWVGVYIESLCLVNQR